MSEQQKKIFMGTIGLCIGGFVGWKLFFLQQSTAIDAVVNWTAIGATATLAAIAMGSLFLNKNHPFFENLLPFSASNPSVYKRGLYIAALYSLIACFLWKFALWATPERHPEYATVWGVVFVLINTVLIFFGIYKILQQTVRWATEKHHHQYRIIQAQQEKEHQQALMTAAMAHDAMNVLASLRFCVELLERNVKHIPATHDLFKTLKKALAELSGLNRKLVESGNAQQEREFQAVDIIGEAQAIIALAKMNERVNSCQIKFYGDAVIQCSLETSSFKDMLLNLILNAADATHRCGTIFVHVRKIGHYALIEVHDNGIGIPDEHKDKIFSPFYTTKADGNGLGLLNVKNCVDLHHGYIQLGDSPIGGAVFSIWIPLKSGIITPPPSSAAPYWKMLPIATPSLF